MSGVGRGNDGGGGETEVAPLPAEGNPYPEGLLDVMLTWPKMSGYVGPAWPRFCFLNVGVAGGERIDFQILPSVRAKVLHDMKNWVLSLTIPMLSDWTGKSLDIFVERIDRDLRQRRLVVTRGGPHTSSYTAVIGRARVRLLDALGIGDLDKEEEEAAAEDNKKRRRRDDEEEDEEEEEGKTKLLWGTVKFDKTVPLLDWELPAQRGEQPRSVVRGTVRVRMCLRQL